MNTIRSAALMLILIAACSVGYEGTRPTPSGAHTKPQAPIITKLNRLQPNESGTKYRPLQIREGSITVDCDHPQIFCDDEEA